MCFFCRQIRAEEAWGLLRPTHHCDGLEFWLRVCGRQVSSSSCIASVADPGSGIRILVLRIRIRDSVPSLPFSSPWWPGALATNMWSPSKFIKMYRQCCGSGFRIRDSLTSSPFSSPWWPGALATSMWSPSKFIKMYHQYPGSRIRDLEFQCSGSWNRCLLCPAHHRDGLELWLRVCGRQVSSSSCITSIPDLGSGIPVLRIRIRDLVPSSPFSSPWWPGALATSMWSPSKFIKLYHRCYGSRIRVCSFLLKIFFFTLSYHFELFVWQIYSALRVTILTCKVHAILYFYRKD
jgi:hypothetical protein